jgi:sugar phosphate isomerase/epimerase
MSTPIVKPPGALGRRAWLQRTAFASVALGFQLAPVFSAPAAAGAQRKMRSALTPGSIGVRANQTEMMRLAVKHGFEAIEPNAGYLGALADDALKALREEMAQGNLTWACAGFPLQFRGDDAAYEQSLKELPKTAAALKRAGVERTGTWISPTHNSLDRAANMKQHATRLREGARILRDHGLRLGLEYVGTRTARAGNRPVFIYNLAGMKELMGEIGLDNVGVILDSWHWWQAGETAADLLTLKNAQVVSVDLNDAPAGVPMDQQQDGKRELPMATGVIDTAAFVNALSQIGYDGPVRAEPFNKALNDMDDEAACAAVSAAMKKALALIK